LPGVGKQLLSTPLLPPSCVCLETVEVERVV
jgi:hypothetical protein